MAARGKKPRAWGEPMFDAAWEWAGAVSKSYGYAVQVSMRPTTRHEVWSVTVRALHVVDGKPAGIAAQVGQEWPDATYASLGATVLMLTSRLELELGQEALLREPAPA